MQQTQITSCSVQLSMDQLINYVQFTTFLTLNISALHHRQHPPKPFSILVRNHSPDFRLSFSLSLLVPTQMLSLQPFTLVQMHLASVWHTCLLSLDDAWPKYLFAVKFNSASSSFDGSLLIMYTVLNTNFEV